MDLPQRHDNISKINETQRVIRNKFKTAYANRIDHEHNVNQAMQPLSDSLSATTTASNHSLKYSSLVTNDVNDLCNRLQHLLESQTKRNVNHEQEIKTIIYKLRDLEIIV